MKLSGSLLLLSFVLGLMLLSKVPARLCRGLVNNRTGTGVAAPPFVCPCAQSRRNSSRCDGVSICCYGPLLRCRRNGLQYITRTMGCRSGNDLGHLFRSASNFIRCYCNQPPLPSQLEMEKVDDYPVLHIKLSIPQKKATSYVHACDCRVCFFSVCNKD